jgi:choline dehydrogenase-like flavoprotein
MRCHSDDGDVDFVIVGTGAGGGALACKLAEHGFSVVALDAGPYWRPLEDFASDEFDQTKLYWTDERIVDGENPLVLGSTILESRLGARGLDRSFRDGLAPLSARMVQVEDEARLRSGLASRLARNVGSLPRGRTRFPAPSITRETLRDHTTHIDPN